MIVYFNGQFVPEDQALVPHNDRGLLYGDGLFETLYVRNAKPFRWTQHLARFQRGADFLKIRVPHTTAELGRIAADLLARNHTHDALLRLTLTRGCGPRGYSPRGADSPTLILSLHSSPEVSLLAPQKWKLATSGFRVPVNDPLSHHKTANKLLNVLARADAEARGADEALLLNTAGEIAETSAGNIFWIEGQHICTPPLAAGILPGVTRELVGEILLTLGLHWREKPAFPQSLHGADGVFVTLSSQGIVEAISLDSAVLKISPTTARLRAAVWQAIRDETKPG